MDRVPKRGAAGSGAPPGRAAGASGEPRHGLCRQIATGRLQCPDLTQRRQALFGLAALCVLMSQFAIFDLASVEGRWQLTPAEDDGRLVVIVTHFGIPGG